ncbi:glycoside hydrolase family protein [Paenibacillus algicola]|uniref:Glycoside hydrolase family protein n=1 Tax=Paenibacillus algicola TaxID=2565926 RepID=A0A4P8XI84_9BACL|nr:beta-galactosidase [Paenibacillus algicola]QCT02307.1 glycoside hydrolase family protein [Paenibacillus algicola]
MKNNVIFLYDPAFPAAADSSLPAAAEGLQALGSVQDASTLSEALASAGEGSCFVNLHAPYFPKQAWPAILAYLKNGGGLLSIGGAPFKIPVRQERESWVCEPEQTAYHQQLHIHETLPVDSARVSRLISHQDISVFSGSDAWLPVEPTWNLVPHVTKCSDLPEQMGSAGPMDTRIYPLVKGIMDNGREVSAPVVLWENTGGPFIGSRWIFVNQPAGRGLWGEEGLKALGSWCDYAARGITELWIKPNYASFEAGERAQLTLQTQRLSKRLTAGEKESWTFRITVQHTEQSSQVWQHELTVEVSGQMDFIRIPVPMELIPGAYRVICSAAGPHGETRTLRQGFWRLDAELLSEGTPITCDRDYFIKDGRPLPVVGMTYMTSDVARKYLFLPNTDVWDRDMAQMKRAGINWIRTGLWTAYRNVMQVDGHASEEVMRSIDAFFLTAKKHDLQVTFTFFSFTPETWEGKNPYLDPRSVEAQKRFIRSIVSRHKNTKHVDWDLINEPSMFDPPRIFSDGPRSARDEFERQAYIEWLRERHGEIEVLQERWNMTPVQLPDFDNVVPPEAEEINFDVQDMHQAKKGTRWLDYALFSMDMHNRWAKELYDAIKDECPDHLVTVGQDEALGAQRPSPFFYAEAADYTTVHSWWLNDNLVWDGIFAKTPDKPNLIQETGIMYVETPEGRAKRSEAELRNILERKYAYAFSTGGAGAVQWIWNTNFYMDNANESHIGAVRADGTEKPEADVSYDFGVFMNGIRDLFKGRELEEGAVVFPYSNDFSNRKLAIEATTTATRVLAYELNMPFRAVGEYDLSSLRKQPVKWILLPSAHNLDDQAFAELVSIVEETGAVLLLTGPLSLDAYWRQVGRLENELGQAKMVNVRREEALEIGNTVYPVSYGSRKIAQVSKEVRSGGKLDQGLTGLHSVQMGTGRLIWCPLPVELNDRIEPVAALYSYMLKQACAKSELEWIHGGQMAGVYGTVLRFAEGSLYVFSSEQSFDVPVEVRDPRTGCTYFFNLETDRSVLFAVDQDGSLISVYRPAEVHVAVVKG